MLSLSDAPPASEVVAAGLVPRLLGFLRDEGAESLMTIERVNRYSFSVHQEHTCCASPEFSELYTTGQQQRRPLSSHNNSRLLFLKGKRWHTLVHMQEENERTLSYYYLDTKDTLNRMIVFVLYSTVQYSTVVQSVVASSFSPRRQQPHVERDFIRLEKNISAHGVLPTTIDTTRKYYDIKGLVFV